MKRDQESGIGRGCVLYADHFRPEIAAIPRAIAETAPHHVEIVWLTEGWRKIRETRDLHETLEAFDAVGTLRTGQRNVSTREYAAWARRAAARLGDRYDVIAHDVDSGWHVHAEYDPKG